jgi:hypothetical protein
VLVTDSAFTVSPRQVGRSSRRPHLDLAKLALDRLLEELSPAGGGHLARPPLRSALHGHRMWCRNSCSLRLLPLLPVQDQAAATSSPSHVHLPQLALAQLPAHAPARARPRPPRPTAPLATWPRAAGTPHNGRPPAPASLARPTVRRRLPVRPHSPASPRGLRRHERRRAAASHQTIVGNAAARPPHAVRRARPGRLVTGAAGEATGVAAAGCHGYGLRAARASPGRSDGRSQGPHRGLLASPLRGLISSASDPRARAPPVGRICGSRPPTRSPGITGRRAS